MLAKLLLDKAEHKVQRSVKRCQEGSFEVIACYTAAIAGNFQLWLAFTTARDPYARWVIEDNLTLEKQEDHVGMLRNFAKFSEATPGRECYDHVERDVAAINKLFTNPRNCGLSGIALVAMLENTSKIFIPDLALRAKQRGCTNFTYTDKHGEADVAHSSAFLKALELEMTMGYEVPGKIVQKAIDAGVALIAKIYT